MEQEMLEENLDLELLKIENELAKIPANLTGYININLTTILSIINKYPRNSKMKIDFSKVTEQVELSNTAYETLIKYLKVKFPNHSLSRSTLSATITRVKKRKGLIIEREKRIVKPMETTTVIIEKEQPLIKKNHSQKLVEDKVSSVSDLKIETGKDSQSALQIGNLSTEQAQSKGLILSEEEENIILNCSNTYFKYKKFLNTLDENATKDKRYGVHNEEINMEILVKTIYKMFEMEFPGTNIGVLSDGQKRSMRIANSNFSEGIKKIASQIWARNDLINLLIGRKNNKNLAVQTA